MLRSYCWLGKHISVLILYRLSAAASGICAALLCAVLPKEHPIDKGGRIDYIGAFLGLSSLLLYNIAWKYVLLTRLSLSNADPISSQAPAVGWSKPYNIAILVVSVTLFLIFLGWEQYYARDPIMPLSVFRTPTFAALIFVVLLSYMAFGILLWYAISWQQTFRHVSVLQTGINLLPFAAGSVIAVGLAAYLLPRIAAQWIMALGVAVVLIACLLLATMPVDQSYWPQTFPAILLSSFCPDFVYLAAQVIASNSVSYKHQGVASSLVGTLNLYGNSLGLGFAGTIETEIAKRVGSSAEGNHMNDVLENVAGTVSGYRAALYFGAAIAAVGLALDFAFVRVPKDEREGWDPEEDVPDAVLTATATSVNRTNSV